MPVSMTQPSARARGGAQGGCRLNQVLHAALRAGETTTAEDVARPTTAAPIPDACSSSKQFKCEHCYRLFSTKGNMVRHVQATHAREGIKMFPCETCGKGFKRKEDLVMHTRVHTGEKPYACGHRLCGRKFARISDLRSHERIHSRDAKTFECRYCGKRFTRPFDLKKHELNIHQQELGSSPAKKTEIRKPSTGSDVETSFFSSGGASNGTTGGGGRKRRVITVAVSGQITTELSLPLPMNPAAHASDPLHPDGSVSTAQQQLQKQQPLQQQCMHQQHLLQPGNDGQRAETSLPPIAPPVAPLNQLLAQPQRPQPPQQPLRKPAAPPKRAAAQYRHVHRKRVRCDAHKHCDPPAETEGVKLHGGAGVAVEPGSIKQHEDKVRQERAKKGGVGGEKTHIHGAACGHVAVLHENHVDFLVEGGQLECYAGKEASQKTREGWVSSAKVGSGGCRAGHVCDDSAKTIRADAASTSSTSDASTAHDAVHWDGARSEQPRGVCQGDSHGPRCGHDVIHHDGHLDYVVNGRLIHPLQPDPAAPDGASVLFEDHGSVRALDDDFVTFWSSLDVLSEITDDAAISWCDMCPTDEVGAGLESADADGAAAARK